MERNKNKEFFADKMGKNRVRTKGSKGKQWPGKLTAAALLCHNAVLGGGDKEGGLVEDYVSLKMTNKTFDTFASDWSQCTNVAFEKRITQFRY